MSDDYLFFFFFFKHLCLPTPRCISQSGRKCKWWKTFAHIPPRHTSAVCRAHVFIYSLSCTSCHPASAYNPAVIMFLVFFKDLTDIRFVFTCKQKQAHDAAKRNYANRWACINLNIHRTALHSDCSRPSHTRPTQHRHAHTPISRPSTSNFSHISSPVPESSFLSCLSDPATLKEIASEK